MKTSRVIFASLAVASMVIATPSPVQQLHPRNSQTPAITITGNAFYQGTTRFYIQGLDYQPGGSSTLYDPLADSNSNGCERDIAEFVKLGINTIRVYMVDNSAGHDTCMNALATAGIYLVLDVNTPKYSINRDDPAASYNAEYLQNVFATIDAFAKYTNVLAFLSGNEVINDDTTTDCAPYVKATTRDMKQYIGSRGYRSIPAGYSAADVADNRMQMAHYMNCGTSDERSDFFCFNDYSWCDPSSFTTSGWDQKVKNFTGYGQPIFLSEYGCITNTRTWQEVAALYNSEMTNVYSGGLAYEYSEEGNGYGMVKINSNGVTELANFNDFKQQLANNPVPSGSGGASSTQATSPCPTADANWNVTNDALPAIPNAAAAFMSSGAGQGLGFSGPGSQNAGGTSTGTATPGSGSVTAVVSAAASSSKSAATSIQRPADFTPLYIGLFVIACSLFGATLL